MGGRVVRIITRLNRGGPLRQLSALVPGLEGLGWSGPVVAGRTGANEQDATETLCALGARVVTLQSLRRGIDVARDARALRRLLAILRHERPDVVHTHMGKAGALGRLAAAIVGVPAVHTFHGHHFEASWPKGALAVLAERRLGRITAAGIVLTPRQRREIVDLHAVLPPERVALIPPGFDVDAWRSGADAEAAGALRARLAPSGEPLFLWAGRFVDVKQPDLLLEAVAVARRPYRLVMLGDGPRRAALATAVRARSLGDRILLPGEVPDPAPWVRAADAVVVTSRSEGAPLIVLEAKALGRPAVATTVGGVPDLIEHLVDGLWVPPGDARAFGAALDRLASDPELMHRLGRRAATDVEARYGARRLAADTAALYCGVRTPRGRYHRR